MRLGEVEWEEEPADSEPRICSKKDILRCLRCDSGQRFQTVGYFSKQVSMEFLWLFIKNHIQVAEIWPTLSSSLYLQVVVVVVVVVVVLDSPGSTPITAALSCAALQNLGSNRCAFGVGNRWGGWQVTQPPVVTHLDFCWPKCICIIYIIFMWISISGVAMVWPPPPSPSGK